MRRLVIFSCVLVFAVAGQALWAESRVEHGSSEDPEADRLYRELQGSLFGASAESEVDQELMEAIHDDLDSIDFRGDPKGDEKVDSIFGANPLTGGGNPLLSAGQRKRWLSTAIASVGYNTVDKHLKKQAAALEAGKVDRSEWYDHVAKCKKICNPVVQGLLYEHVRQVANRPHTLLTFATGSAVLSQEHAENLEGFVDAAAERGARFLLIGRGSRTGNREFNRTLSARRVESVRASLQRYGVASDAVSGFWLGYEPPQISDEIAGAYRLDPGLDDLVRNQSVMVVAYR